MTNVEPFPPERRYRIVPLDDSGTSVAYAYNFSGVIYVVTNGDPQRSYVVHVVNGQTERVTQEFGEKDFSGKVPGGQGESE